MKSSKRLLKTFDPLIKKYGHSYETVERRKEGLGRGFLSIYRFFSLLAFVALNSGVHWRCQFGAYLCA